MKRISMILLLFTGSIWPQELQPVITPNGTKLLRVFVDGNNATALEARRMMNWNAEHPKQLEKYMRKHPGYQARNGFACFELANNPKDADAILAIESVRNSGATGFHPTNYTSSAILTDKDGTLLWSDSLGDGSKFADTLIGGDPKVSATRLLHNAAKKMCQP